MQAIDEFSEWIVEEIIKVIWRLFEKFDSFFDTRCDSLINFFDFLHEVWLEHVLQRLLCITQSLVLLQSCVEFLDLDKHINFLDKPRKSQIKFLFTFCRALIQSNLRILDLLIDAFKMFDQLLVGILVLTALVTQSLYFAE
jgi:hypothetical protein